MKQCQLCGKGSIVRGARKKLRGKYNPTGNKRKYPNLQYTRTTAGERVLACTQCIKGIGKKSYIAPTPAIITESKAREVALVS